MTAGVGLSHMPTEALKRLLRHLHRGELVCPLTAERIAVIGFQYKHAELMDTFRGLSAEAVRAVLVCVLAERIHNQGVNE